MTIARFALAGLVLGSGAAWAQAPAPAAKPTIPQICTTCHKAEPGNLRGIFENVAFKSQAIQLKIDATTEIVKFDPKTLKVVDAGAPSRPTPCATSRRTRKRGSSTSRRTAPRSPR